MKYGPVVDDGAPYSAIGMLEVQLLNNQSTTTDIAIDAKPLEL